MRIISACFLFILGGALCAQPNSQIKRVGLPMITNYSQADYDFSSHNYDVLIGDDQKIYFANNQGILVFDGVTWTRLKLPSETPIYTLTKSSDGTIYVGAVNEIGYLDTGPSGKLEYVSLKEQIPDDELEVFTARVYAIRDKIVASISGKIMLINPITQEIKLVENPGDDCSIQSLSGKLYAFCGDQLYQLKSDDWEFLRATHHLENTQVGRGHLIETNSNQKLVISQRGFYDFDTESKISINEEVEEFIGESIIYRVSILSDRYIAICTWSGLLITDLIGNPVLFLDEKRGLSNNYLYRVVLDKHGMLWMATYNGISKIDLFSSYSLLDKRMNVEGVIKDVQLHNGNLYYSAVSGVFSEDWESLQAPFFSPSFESANSSVCHQMINTGEDLFVYTERQNNLVLENGHFQEIEGTQEKIYWAGFKYKNSDDLLLASHDGFIAHLVKENHKWIVKKHLDPQFLGVYFLIEGESDNIWLSNVGEGIYRMKYDLLNAEILEDKKYGVADGLPDLNGHVYEIDSKPCFVTSKGIYRYDATTDSFVPDERFEELVGEVPISMIDEDERGNIYYYSDEFVMLKKTSDGFVKVLFPNMDFKKYPPSDITLIDYQNVMISSLNAIVHVDPSMAPAANQFNVSITKLSSLRGDSTIFSGFGPTPDALLFSSNNNALRIRFSAAFHQNPEQTRYKWRLNGFDETWSDWTNETQKDYTNLPHGNFSFEVMAINVHGVESAPSRVQFTIDAPWYLTIWAYLFYVAGFILFMFIILKLNTRRLQIEKKRLEQIVADRTTEISQQRNKLSTMDDLKKRFFVNISHELRTPLTLSMGTVNQALTGKYGEVNDKLYANLKVSKRNNERLLKMVNSILDISKLEGGRIQLYARAQNPATTIKKVLAFFSSRFEDKNIELRSDLIEDTELFLDDDRFETILINLFSNAFKFTPDGGRIEVAMIEQEDRMEIKIKDSGEGIPEQDMELVFDRFYQSPTIKSGEGMGVGLALTKELVELHRGNVYAKNNGGAEFVLSFLKGSAHLAPNEIVEDKKATGALDDKYPLHDDTKEEITIEANSDASEHILLVEDNPEMAQFIVGILQNKYRISHVSNGLEGLHFLKGDIHPDLIITDYLMPKMDGYEMAQEIKKDPELSSLPMIFLTARAREQDKINVLNLGVDDYLFKPFNTEELLVRIKNLLYTQKQRSEYVQEELIDPRDIEWKDFASKLKLKVDEFLETHLAKEITSRQLADFTNQSERTLYRKIKVNTGLTIMGYVKEYRLRKARTMLENQEMQTVSEISYAVGFNFLSHFTKSYKERFGKQPSKYLE
jgi:signal transduction histidine kinase/DNA-binding response OmpR family regulator